MPGKNIDLKFFLALIIAFIFFGAIGTITHEFGHWIMAKSLGYQATIAYNMTYYDDNSIKEMASHPTHRIWIQIAGPFESALTASIGLLLLFRQKKYFYESSNLNFSQWLLVFVTLFWARTLYIFVRCLMIALSTGIFPDLNDEVKIAEQLGWHKLSIFLPLAIISFFVMMVVIFKFVPKQQRLTFILSGLIGGIFGMYNWHYLLGPLLMP